MVFGSPKQRSLLEGVTWDQAFGYATDTFRRAMPGIAAHGTCRCAWNRSARRRPTSSTPQQEGARLMEAVGHPNFVLHLDVKAMSSEPTPIPDIIRQYANRTGHFHANDPNRRGPGLRRRGLRADFSGVEGVRLRPLGLGRGVRLHARPGDDRREEHRVHARCLRCVVSGDELLSATAAVEGHSTGLTSHRRFRRLERSHSNLSISGVPRSSCNPRLGQPPSRNSQLRQLLQIPARRSCSPRTCRRSARSSGSPG